LQIVFQAPTSGKVEKSIDLVKLVCQVDHVKIKTGELKTHLSHYLRVIRETGEDIEVCVREQPVAYLTRTKEDPVKKEHHQKTAALRQNLLSAGLVLSMDSAGPQPLVMPVPTPAGDRRRNVSAVKEMRASKNW
jgi:antitoxin (DNA-binding transcriptional repressor) of toxin-antitoxin stability system